MTYFWLAWNRRKNDFVRLKTGQTLAELVREANRLGCRWKTRTEGNGLWFEFDVPGSLYARERRRR